MPRRRRTAQRRVKLPLCHSASHHTVPIRAGTLGRDVELSLSVLPHSALTSRSSYRLGLRRRRCTLRTGLPTNSAAAPTQLRGRSAAARWCDSPRDDPEAPTTDALICQFGPSFGQESSHRAAAMGGWRCLAGWLRWRVNGCGMLLVMLCGGLMNELVSALHLAKCYLLQLAPAQLRNAVYCS